MSTTLEDPPPRRQAATPAERMRTSMAAVRLSVRWFGTRKTLNAEQKAQAADTFGAEGEFLSAGKKLIDTKHPAFKAVTAVKTKAVGFWKVLTLPFPENGIRLIAADRLLRGAGAAGARLRRHGVPRGAADRRAGRLSDRPQSRFHLSMTHLLPRA